MISNAKQREMIDINKFEKLADEIISNVKKDGMKTPIQELLEHFTDAWSSPSDLWKPSKVIAKIETMIEKEKEFIEDVYEDGLEQEYQFHINGKKQISSLEYYDKNFNQKNANK